MDNAHNLSSPSLFDPSLWDDSEEFIARMKYEGRAMPISENTNALNKLPVFLIGGPVLALLLTGVLVFPF